MEKNQVYEIIKDWWNDNMRKDWRQALSYPPERYNRFEELANKLSRHLTSQDKLCAICGGLRKQEELTVCNQCARQYPQEVRKW